MKRRGTSANPTDPSQLVGVVRLAEMYGMSRWWALNLLKEWYAAQQKGGPTRVVRIGPQNAHYTTLAVLHQAMPPARDMHLVRQVERLERDVTALARRCDELTSLVHELRRAPPSLGEIVESERKPWGSRARR